MRIWSSFGRLAALGTVIALGLTVTSAPAEASGKLKSGRHAHADYASGGSKVRYASMGDFGGHGGSVKHAYFSKSGSKGARFAHWGGISCVPFARGETGIELSGNAWSWWDHAAGVYARGNKPEASSILNFRASGRMSSGHVAVVSEVVGAREIIIDHANWPGGGRGGVSRGVSVVDVSPANDWTEVKVAMGRTGEYGSVYPTYGFIYDRPDRGGSGMTASAAMTARPTINVAVNTPTSTTVSRFEPSGGLPVVRVVSHKALDLSIPGLRF